MRGQFDENGLTARQRDFVNEYLSGKSASQAALAAGYSRSTAGKAHRWVKDDYWSEGNKIRYNLIKPVIEKRQAVIKQELQLKADVTIDRVLQELARIGFSDIRQIYNEDGSLKSPAELDEDTAASISEFNSFEAEDEDGVVAQKSKVKQWEKTKALEMLGRYLGMFPTRGSLDVAVSGGGDPEAIARIEGRRTVRRLILEEVREENEDNLMLGQGAFDAKFE